MRIIRHHNPIFVEDPCISLIEEDIDYSIWPSANSPYYHYWIKETVEIYTIWIAFPIPPGYNSDTYELYARPPPNDDES